MIVLISSLITTNTSYAVRTLPLASTGLAHSDTVTAPYIAGDILYVLKTGNYSIAASSEPGDMWSMGVVLFQLCTGRLPFECEGITDGVQARDNLLAQLMSWKVRDCRQPTYQFAK